MFLSLPKRQCEWKCCKSVSQSVSTGFLKILWQKFKASISWIEKSVVKVELLVMEVN